MLLNICIPSGCITRLLKKVHVDLYGNILTILIIETIQNVQIVTCYLQ